MSGLTISWWAFACPLSCFILTCHIEYMNSSSSLPCSCHTHFCGRPWDCLFRWAQTSEKMMKEATFECLGFQLLAMSCNLYVNIFGPQQISFSTALFPPLALVKKTFFGLSLPNTHQLRSKVHQDCPEWDQDQASSSSCLRCFPWSHFDCRKVRTSTGSMVRSTI